MAKVRGYDLHIDWTDIDQVKRLAAKMGPTVVVVKHADRSNYNIAHLSRADLVTKPGVKIIR